MSNSRFAPWLFQCKKSQSTLHTWRRNGDGTATCVDCGIKLNKADAEDCFTDKA